MPPSRNFWLLLACTAVPLPFLFLPALAPGSTPWLQSLWDVGHVPLFAVWMVLALRLVPLPRTPLFVVARALFLASIAMAIEYIQLHAGRSFSTLDMYLDACGIAVGARLALPAWQTLPKIPGRITDLALIAMIAFGLKDAGLSLFDRIYMGVQFPQLWSAAQPIPQLRLDGSSTRELIAKTGADRMPLLRVSYGTDEFSSFEMVAMTGDWRRYSTLRIAVLNPALATLDIICRIHDEQHYANGAALDDRFNRRFTLTPGWNTLSINVADVESAPAHRKMRMDRIENLNCFTIRLANPRQVYFREIWLSP